MEHDGGPDHGRPSRFGMPCHVFATNGPEARDRLATEENVLAAPTGRLRRVRLTVRSEAGQPPRVATLDGSGAGEARVARSHLTRFMGPRELGRARTVDARTLWTIVAQPSETS